MPRRWPSPAVSIAAASISMWPSSVVSLVRSAARSISLPAAPGSNSRTSIIGGPMCASYTCPPDRPACPGGNPVFDPVFDPVPDPGLNSGRNPGFNPGFNPILNPVRNPAPSVALSLALGLAMSLSLGLAPSLALSLKNWSRINSSRSSSTSSPEAWWRLRGASAGATTSCMPTTGAPATWRARRGTRWALPMYLPCTSIRRPAWRPGTAGRHPSCRWWPMPTGSLRCARSSGRRSTPWPAPRTRRSTSCPGVLTLPCYGRCGCARGRRSAWTALRSWPCRWRTWWTVMASTRPSPAWRSWPCCMACGRACCWSAPPHRAMPAAGPRPNSRACVRWRDSSTWP